MKLYAPSIACVLLLSACEQQVTQVNGRVTDEMGVVLSGAKVTLSTETYYQEDSDFSHTDYTDEDGRYSVQVKENYAFMVGFLGSTAHVRAQMDGYDSLFAKLAVDQATQHNFELPISNGLDEFAPGLNKPSELISVNKTQLSSINSSTLTAAESATGVYEVCTPTKPDNFRADLFQCELDDASIQGACFLDVRDSSGNTAICVRYAYWSHFMRSMQYAAYRYTLDDAVPQPIAQADTAINHPLYLMLDDGSKCDRQIGESEIAHTGDRLSYRCSKSIVLLGDVHVDTVWTVTQASTERRLEDVPTVIRGTRVAKIVWAGY